MKIVVLCRSLRTAGGYVVGINFVRALREVPALTATLPSMALSTQGGGEISLDPNDRSGARALANLLHLELELAESRRVGVVGERVYVRFFHGTEPLFARLYRNLRQVFMKRFNV